MTKVLTIESKSKKIKSIQIGGAEPVFTIAEIGLNHNGEMSVAKAMIDSAAAAGCSSVKFQNFETDNVYISGDKAGKYKLMGEEIPIYELHTRLEVERDFLKEAKAYAEEKGLMFFSAPMGPRALENLISIDCDVIKVASYEITNLPWIREVASTHKPIIMSSGGASISEIDRALNEIFKVHDDVALMHCVLSTQLIFKMRTYGV